MTRIMLIDAADAQETRVAITQDGDIAHFDFVSKAKKQIKGNIYLAKVTRVEPSLQAAFVEYGGDKQGFLSFSEVHPDYYQIPVEDRKRLLEEVAAAEAREALRESDEDEEEGREAGSDEEGDATASEEDEEDAKPRRGRRRGGVRRRGRRSVGKRAESESEEEGATASGEASDDAEGSDASGNGDDNAPIAMAAKRTPVIASEEASGETSGDDAQEEAEEDVALEGEPIPEPSDVAVQQEAGEDTEVVETRNSSAATTEDEEDDIRKRRPGALLRRYKIQEVIRPGQIVLVQVIKEERGNKGVSLSTYISLAGRYCVLMPNSHKAGGISRKISSGEDRKRLREISNELKDWRGMNAIIRTAGIDRTRAEIRRDYEYLIKLWNQVREDALASIAPALVYEENDIIKRSIRDHYDSDIEAIHVEGEEAYKQAKDFMKMLMPSHAARVKQFKEAQPLFSVYGMESQIAELYRTTASLRSGGYIVINPTEALISIDVNSGRSTNERNVEETAYKTNLEACAEIARQLRLRNLGGLVVIDFIDMMYHKYRRNVERALKEALKEDRARVQIGHISSFGLLELSRQRMGASLVESTTEPCPTCQGHGRVEMLEFTLTQMMRNLQAFLSEYDGEQLTVIASQRVMLELLNTHRGALRQLEETYGVTLEFELSTDGDDTLYQFRGRGGARFDSSEGFVRSRASRGKRGGRGGGNRSGGGKPQEAAPQPRKSEPRNATPSPQESDEEEEVSTDAVQEGQDEEESGARKRSRSRRRGSRGGKRRNEGAEVSASGDADNKAVQEERADMEEGDDREEEEPSFVDPSPAPAPAAHQPREAVAVRTVVPQREISAAPVLEDTPAPQKKRRGWWNLKGE